MSELHEERMKRIRETPGDLPLEDEDTNWLIQQAEENKRLREENYRLRITYENTGTMMDRAALRAENKKQKEMLLHLYRYMGMSADHDAKLWKKLETFLGGREKARAESEGKK